MRTCQKCGHANPVATNTDTEACPACGAIYARVEAAIAAGTFRAITARAVAPTVPTPAHAPPPVAPAAPVAQLAPRPVAQTPFIETLRAGSNYPAVRSVAGIFAVIGYLVWGLFGLIGAALTMAQGQVGAGLGAMVFCLVMLVLTRLFKELALMVADLSDAAVVTAERLSSAARS